MKSLRKRQRQRRKNADVGGPDSTPLQSHHRSEPVIRAVAFNVNLDS